MPIHKYSPGTLIGDYVKTYKLVVYNLVLQNHTNICNAMRRNCNMTLSNIVIKSIF